MSRKMRMKVAGVKLRRGLKRDSWYANIGPNNVAVEFRPRMGRRRASSKPIDWKAYRFGKWASRDVCIVTDMIRLKACVEKVTALYWGEPEETE